jgi:hypothetical protein
MHILAGMIDQCVHIRAKMITPVCVLTYGYDHAMCTYTYRHDCTYVSIHAWAGSIICVHAVVGIIVPVFAYTREHDLAYVCIYVMALSRVCVRIRVQIIAAFVHQRVNMIAPMCAYTQDHDRVGTMEPMCAYTLGMIAPVWSYTVRIITQMCAYT